jgi:hypothetical protein
MITICIKFDLVVTVDFISCSYSSRTTTIIITNLISILIDIIYKRIY